MIKRRVSGIIVHVFNITLSVTSAFHDLYIQGRRVVSCWGEPVLLVSPRIYALDPTRYHAWKQKQLITAKGQKILFTHAWLAKSNYFPWHAMWHSPNLIILILALHNSTMHHACKRSVTVWTPHLSFITTEWHFSELLYILYRVHFYWIRNSERTS